MKEKILVAMSGGVDSAVAALLVKEMGYETAGVTMRLCEKETNDVSDAKKICDSLGIRHYELDMRSEFEELVIRRFIDEYKNGATPNPCVECNRQIKFGKLLDAAATLGYDRLATGHYARICQTDDGRYLLRQAKDKTKDQSYFLWSLSPNALSRVLFPLGELSKPEIRKIAEENGFVNAHKSDSQDICFIENNDYVGFIERRTDQPFPAGDFIDSNGNVLGRHRGLIRYTVGQRKGLGIALGYPAFVSEKNAKLNTITLCEDKELYRSKLRAVRCMLHLPASIGSSLRARAKIRYRHEGADATVTLISPTELDIVFDEPQRAPAKGQSIVLYDGDVLIGGGIID